MFLLKNPGKCIQMVPDAKLCLHPGDVIELDVDQLSYYTRRAIQRGHLALVTDQAHNQVPDAPSSSDSFFDDEHGEHDGQG